jgi:hypothetical protein
MRSAEPKPSRKIRVWQAKLDQNSDSEGLEAEFGEKLRGVLHEGLDDIPPWKNVWHNVWPLISGNTLEQVK